MYIYVVKNLYMYVVWLNFISYSNIYIYIYISATLLKKKNKENCHFNTKKMVPDAALLNTQHYKVMIKGKVEQSKEWSSALPYTTV